MLAAFQMKVPFTGPMPVGPTRLNHHGTRQGIAGPGDAPSSCAVAAGMFARHQSQPGHQLPRIGEAADIADFGSQGCGNHGIDPTQRSQRINDRSKSPGLHRIVNSQIKRPDAFFDLANSALQFLESDLLMR